MPPLPLDVDPDDGGPTWRPATGTLLVEGQLAWSPLTTGYHCQTWLCWSLELWTPTLVKVVRPGWTRPRWTRALARESAALRGLAHPAFPRLLADRSRSTLPHLVLEYLDGPALDEVLDRDGPLSAADTARLGVGLLGAVRSLHATGRAHLDVCPDNVLIVDRRVRLVDLGAARSIGRPLRRGERLGTDGFAAPEVESGGGGPVTPAMDVHAVGATLQAVLDPDEDGRLRDVLPALTAADPGARPTVEKALALLVRLTGRGPGRSWPSWADRALPRRRSGASRGPLPGAGPRSAAGPLMGADLRAAAGEPIVPGHREDERASGGTGVPGRKD